MKKPLKWRNTFELSLVFNNWLLIVWKFQGLKEKSLEIVDLMEIENNYLY